MHIEEFEPRDGVPGEPVSFIFSEDYYNQDPNLSVCISPWLWEQWYGSQWDHSGEVHILLDHINISGQKVSGLINQNMKQQLFIIADQDDAALKIFNSSIFGWEIDQAGTIKCTALTTILKD